MIENGNVSPETVPRLRNADIRPVVFSSGGGVALRIEQVWKQYRLGVINHGTLARDLQSWWARLRGHEDPNLPVSHTEGGGKSGERFWALQDVSFDVCQGEVVGIIGKNGAGKSTLLKILSQVTVPTRGQIKLRGRVASLLEVGTGFHPELTGRENVFLNGAILGMNKAEVSRKLDEIIAFAEIDKFIDTPVKRYSSGMYVRLAFAVAAHLEPEILIVDEVLAVGDAEFQRKSLGKMEEVSRGGRTVLFVSHNMPSIERLCGRVVWIDQGTMVKMGDPVATVEEYLNGDQEADEGYNLDDLVRKLPEDPAIKFLDVSIGQEGENFPSVVTGKDLKVSIRYEVLRLNPGLRVYIILSDKSGAPIFRSLAHSDEAEIPVLRPGKYTSEVTLPADFLAPVAYRLGIYASIYNARHCFAGEGVVVGFQVKERGRIKYAYALSGPINFKLAPLLPWKTEFEG